PHSGSWPRRAGALATGPVSVILPAVRVPRGPDVGRVDVAGELGGHPGCKRVGGSIVWIVEPATAEETEVELLAVEEELKAKRVEFRACQAEILDMEGARGHLKALLAIQ